MPFGYDHREIFYRSATTVAARALRERDGARVVLKYQVADYPSLAEIGRYRHEYEILRGVDSPLVLRALGLERWENRLVLVTEDFGGETLGEYFAGGEPSARRLLTLAVQLAQALAFIHERGLIHKDINPQNVLVDPSSGSLKLIDFGISTLLSRENHDPKHPEHMEGTLPFMSPEQTGRMNRALDHRSDLYSTGATLYALAAGLPPFVSDDPLEIVHCHIAKPPAALRTLVPWVPQALSDIVDKCLSKPMEDRYLSATGLLRDLQECLGRSEEPPESLTFAHGLHDVSHKFEVPQTLYGRDLELAAMLEAVERTAAEGPELLLVGGYSGIGKSSLVREIHKAIVAKRGYVISGKYDQYNRGIPYSAVAAAFTELVRSVLMDRSEVVAKWRDEILRALGPTAQVVLDVVPAFERLLGPQPPVPPLSSSEAQARLNRAFCALVRVFARPQHPLVLSLDDLQWADSSSVDLLRALLSDPQMRHLLVIAAYRDNEVDASHAFMMAVDEVKRAGVAVREMSLGPLGGEDTLTLVAETVRAPRPEAAPLAELLHERAAGNPFFLVQLLRTLHEDGRLRLDPSSRWTWDLDEIRAFGLTDDVVELVTTRLQRMPASTRRCLMFAACMGGRFDLGVLSIVRESPPQATARELWPALADGLVVPATPIYTTIHGGADRTAEGDPAIGLAEERMNRAVVGGELRVAYRFIHDRVQQAAYALIPEAQRAAEHLRIGRLLVKPGPDALSDEEVFDVLSHLNRGLDLVGEPSEREAIARLNQRAGRRAKLATAYQAAAVHFEVAMRLLGDDLWSRDYRLAFDLHRERAECEYIAGRFALADELTASALAHGTNSVDKASVLSTRIQLNMTRGTGGAKLVELAVEAMNLLGFDVPADPAARLGAAHEEAQKIARWMEGRQVADLDDHPPMTDPEKRATLDLLMVAWAAAYYAQEAGLTALAAYLMVTTCFEYGHAPSSAFVYVLHGLMLGVGGDYPRGYQFGSLGMRLNQRYPDPLMTVRAGNVFAHSLNPYFNPLETNLPYYQATYRLAPQVGELLYGVWAVSYIVFVKTMKGDTIQEVLDEWQKYLGFVVQTNDRNMTSVYKTHRQMLLCLQGRTSARNSLDDDSFNEAAALEEFRRGQFHVGFLLHGVFRTALHVMFREYSAAIAAARVTEEAIAFDIGLVTTTNHYFYQSLAVAGALGTTDSEGREAALPILDRNLARLNALAENAPMNFAHRRDLVAAEIARHRGQSDLAGRLYDQAIDGAKASGFTHDEALASETAALFYIADGRLRIARMYLADARYAYLRWGAEAKVADLDRIHGKLTASEGGWAPIRGAALTTTATGSDALDFATVMKAAQALSGEIEKSTLVDKLMRIAMQNAGARRGWLVLGTPEGLVVAAEACVADERVQSGAGVPLEQAVDLPAAVVQYVARSREAVVLRDACREGLFGADERVRARRCRSIASLPLLRQGHLTGVLHLENDLVEGAFTAQRVEVLQLLAAQAAISLENAGLYGALEARVVERTRALEEVNRSLRSLVETTRAVPWQWDRPSRRFLYVGPQAQALLGCPASEWLQANFLDERVHPDDRELVMARDPANRVRSEIEPEFRLRRDDGRWAWVRGIVSRGKDEDDSRPTGFLLDITERRQMEFELHQAQKLESVGRLASGIAHEINTPIQFVRDSIHFVRGALEDIMPLLQRYRALAEDARTAGQDDRVSIEEADLPYLLENLPAALERSTDGLERVATIVRSMKEFAHPEQTEAKPIDLNRALETTLTIARSEYRHVADVQKDLVDMPPVTCHASAMNQVLLNLIVNAAHAIADAVRGTERRGTITVVTRAVGEDAVIAVSDTGVGIPEKLRAKVFEPFFTTKEVGKGTGQGLSLARAVVVDKHGGTIGFESEVGKGTTFTVRIPMVGKAARAASGEAAARPSTSRRRASEAPAGV